MKLKIFLFSTAIALAGINQGFSKDVIAPTRTIPTETTNALRAQELLNRLEEIKTIDTKSLTKTEKRSLRKEVKSIEKEMKTMASGGIYISVGALLVIILLILLL